MEKLQILLKKIANKTGIVDGLDRIDKAFQREKQVQEWSRRKEEALINSQHNNLPFLSTNYTQFLPNLKNRVRSVQAPQFLKELKY